jgi:hypothetical protein
LQWFHALFSFPANGGQLQQGLDLLLRKRPAKLMRKYNLFDQGHSSICARILLVGPMGISSPIRSSDHLALAALLAISFRRSGVSLLRRAFPPFRPKATAFASLSFFLAMCDLRRYPGLCRKARKGLTLLSAKHMLTAKQ